MGFQSNYDDKRALWEVTLDGKKLLEYVHGEADDPNPSFRLVRTMNGEDITVYRPWDHPWHPGLFFSWKYINGLNFWESMYDGQRNVAVTDKFAPFNEGGPGFIQDLSYVAHNGVTLLKETRKVQITSAEGGYFIHWQGAFTAGIDAEITLDRTVRTEKEPWGGYAGLSCRLNRNFLGPVITTNEGVSTAVEADAKPYQWCDYSGKLDGYIQKRWAGICIMDHPSNPRYPAPVLTYDYKDMQFLQAAFLFNEPYVLGSGNTFDLKYTFYVHDGEADQEKFNGLWKQTTEL